MNMIYIIGLSLILTSCGSLQNTVQTGYDTITSIGTNVGIMTYDMRPDNYFNDPRTYNMWWDYYNVAYLDGKPHYSFTITNITDIKNPNNVIKHFQFFYRQNF